MFDKTAGNAMGQSPISGTPGPGMTPGWPGGVGTGGVGAGGQGDYFGAPGQGQTPTDGGATPSLKIRLGMGGGK